MPAKKGKKRTSRKQRRDFLPGIHHFLAALYWLVRLIFLIWDKLAG